MDDAGRSPIWNETLTIKFETEQVAKESSLKIVCFDEDLIMDSHVGQAVFLVSDLLGDKKWIELKYRGKKAAEILIEAKFEIPLIGQTVGVKTVKISTGWDDLKKVVTKDQE